MSAVGLLKLQYHISYICKILQFLDTSAVE